MTQDQITKFRMFLAEHFDLRLYTEPTTGFMYSAEHPIAAELYNELARLHRKQEFDHKWYETHSKLRMEEFERNKEAD